jgi:hypothetical protein
MRATESTVPASNMAIMPGGLNPVGSIITVTITPPSGQRIVAGSISVAGVDNIVLTAMGATFPMPVGGGEITVNAQFEPIPSDVSPPSFIQWFSPFRSGSVVINGIDVPYTISNETGVANFNVTAALLDQLLAAADGSKFIVVDIGMPTGLNGMDINFPPAWFTDKARKDVTVAFYSGIGGVYLNENLASKFPEQNTEASTSLNSGSLTFSARQNNRAVTWDCFIAPVIIYMPYRLSRGVNANDVVMYNIVTDDTVAHSFYKDGRLYAVVNAPGEYGARFDTVTFTDTVNHWAREYIAFVSARDMISETAADRFSPDTAILRADFIMALGRLAGADVSEYTQSSFDDVADDDPAMPYIEWAFERGIVMGVGGGRFAPDMFVTREQMAVMMTRYANITMQSIISITENIAFTDVESISYWATEASAVIAHAGIIIGKPDNLFDPQGDTTRAEASAILRRFAESVVAK